MNVSGNIYACIVYTQNLYSTHLVITSSTRTKTRNENVDVDDDDDNKKKKCPREKRKWPVYSTV